MVGGNYEERRGKELKSKSNEDEEVCLRCKVINFEK